MMTREVEGTMTQKETEKATQKMITEQKTRLKKVTLVFLILSILCINGLSFMGSRFWFYYLIFMEVIMPFAILAEIKNKKKKTINHEFKDAEILFPLEVDHNNNIFLWWIPYVLLFIFQGYEGLSEKGSMGWFLLYVVMIVLISGGAFVLYRKWSTCFNFACTEGVKLFSKELPFDQIKRHQFIKNRKGGYFFEVNDGKAYYRFKVSEMNMKVLEEVLLTRDLN